MSSTGCKKLPFSAGCSPALANSEAIHWMATASPFCNDIRPSSASEARNVRSARSVSSRIKLNPVATLAGIGCWVSARPAKRKETRRARTTRSILLSFMRSEEHTSELQSRLHLVCRLLLEKKKKIDVGDQTAVLCSLEHHARARRCVAGGATLRAPLSVDHVLLRLRSTSDMSVARRRPRL